MDLIHTAQREAPLRSILRTDMHLSGTLIRRLKLRSAFFVNGVNVYTNYNVRPGDVIQVFMPEQAPEYPAEPGDLHILFEDEALIAVDKPQNMLVHPSHNVNSGTLANLVQYYFSEKQDPSSVHPVTRLDRDTFGVVLIAKNAWTHASLHRSQLKHAFSKTYFALLDGIPPQDQLVIREPIFRPDPCSVLRCVDPAGQEAETRLSVLCAKNGHALVRLEPVTGRTHQLRVHCAWLGCPVHGDPQYGTAAGDCSGQLLCAGRLLLQHPITGEELDIRSRQVSIIQNAAENCGLCSDLSF